jgi:alkanesulfonate monooxygenase SsuD/methylene tetrahydromethanopterin reductase-like flavin-dependent oxidoreductase (luciferase family)
MDFGVLQFFSWPGRRVPLETVYERALNRIEIMDKTGYEAVWLAEHHFSTYSVCPSVHLMGMQVANRTKRLRIGTAVTLAAFYHPLRIAEEVALLDVLSGGRVNWVAGSSAESVGWAGELGHGVMLSPHLPFKTIDEHQKIFRSALQKHGHSGDRKIPVARLLAVADTEAEAAATAQRGAEWIFSTYRNESKSANYQLNQSGNKPEVTSVDQYLDDVAIWGTPAKVQDTIHRLQDEIGLNYLMCAPLSHSSFMTFTDKVLPKFV